MRRKATESGGKVIDDFAGATKWALKNGYADRECVCTHGASFGGYASLMMAVKNSDLVKCLAGFAGAYDLNLMFSQGDIQWISRGQAYL